MEIDVDLLRRINVNRTLEENRRRAQRYRASALAYEFFAEGVTVVSLWPREIHPDAFRPPVDNSMMTQDEAKKIGKMNLAVLKFVRPAWSITQHWNLGIELQKRIGDLSAEDLFYASNFKVAYGLLDGDEDRLEEAWQKAVDFVSEWETEIRNVSERLVKNKLIEGEEIEKLVEEHS